VAPATASPTDTREQIVRIARTMIATRSYLGFSFQDIADQVGIRKPSLYHHFPTKEALGIEVLKRATEGFRLWAAKTPASPQKKLGAYFRLYRDTLHAGSRVCPAGALAPGWDCIEGELQRAVIELRATQIAWLTGVLSELGPKKRARQARQRAAHLFAICQGALLSSRMTGAVADFDDAVGIAERSLGL
jgi:TetR/AcrR family transcriptional repressor of nem operon